MTGVGDTPGEALQAAVAEAGADLAAGRRAEAEAAFARALAIAPHHPVLLHNLGVLIAARGDPQSAIARFDAALAADPGYASAHYNRAAALEAIGERRAAIEGFARTVAIDGTHYQAHRALGFLWLADGETGRALDHFAATYDLRRGEERTDIAVRSLTRTNRTKLEHDAAQFAYLAAGRPPPNRFETLARNYARAAELAGEAEAPLTDAQWDLLGEQYNGPIHLAETPAIPGPAVTPRADVDRLTAAVAGGGPGATWVDDLLTPEALGGLRRHLLRSTIWHDFSHIDGHVASYLEDGLACPLLLQIADELRRAWPDLLGEHALTQAWAFKGVRPRALIDVHADDAAYSVNFWLTPDEANDDAARGGMRLCLTPPPEEWAVEGYDSGVARATRFLKDHHATTLVVPYRQNRGVIFRSRLLHVSDEPNFVAGYEAMRLNLTMLFGVA